MYSEGNKAEIVMSKKLIVNSVELPVNVTFQKLDAGLTNFSSTAHLVLQTVAEYRAVVVPGLNMVLGPTTDRSECTRITVTRQSKWYFLPYTQIWHECKYMYSHSPLSSKFKNRSYIFSTLKCSSCIWKVFMSFIVCVKFT